jgi:hypothetical protein
MFTHRFTRHAGRVRVRRTACARAAVVSFCAAALALPAAAHAQPQARRTFATPQEAVRSLVEVARSGELRRLRDVFGSEVDRLMSDDTVQMRRDFETFANRATRFAEATQVSSERYEIIIGEERWPFPVPLQRAGRGWQFDTEAGVEEVLARWIGENELSTVSVLEALAAAQWDYFLDSDWDHDQVHEFAQRFMSSEGAKDGLYWPTAPQEPASPLGAMIALASDEGYVAGGDEPTPFHAPVPRERQHDQRVRCHRLSGQLRRLRRDVVHRQPAGARVRTGPRRRHRVDRLEDGRV